MSNPLFDHYRYSARQLVADIANLAGEYLTILNRSDITAINTGTLEGRPVWLTRLQRFHAELATELNTVRKGVVT
jgi:hypothetical protein